MPTQRQRADTRRDADRVHRSLAEDVRRIREDAGATRSQLALAAGVDLAYLCRIEDGRARPSIDVYGRLARALGSDLGARIYPNTGPAIRDRHQARILEALLGTLDPRWSRYLEVAVRRPARGFIDLVLHAPATRELVAVEIESSLRRVEQLLRWTSDKAASMPSWEGWSQLGDVTEPSRLLVVRATRLTRTVGHELERQLRVAYPAHPADAIASLSGTAPWPGAAVIWARVERSGVRLIPER